MTENSTVGHFHAGKTVKYWAEICLFLALCLLIDRWYQGTSGARRYEHLSFVPWLAIAFFFVFFCQTLWLFAAREGAAIFITGGRVSYVSRWVVSIRLIAGSEVTVAPNAFGGARINLVMPDGRRKWIPASLLREDPTLVAGRIQAAISTIEHGAIRPLV